MVVDVSQYSNLEIMGSKYLKYQEGYVLESLAAHLEGNDKFLSSGEGDQKSKLLYDFRDLKCSCQESLIARKRKQSQLKSEGLSIGESFLQYYYLCQRKIHQDVER